DGEREVHGEPALAEFLAAGEHGQPFADIAGDDPGERRSGDGENVRGGGGGEGRGLGIGEGREGVHGCSGWDEIGAIMPLERKKNRDLPRFERTAAMSRSNGRMRDSRSCWISELCAGDRRT